MVQGGARALFGRNWAKAFGMTLEQMVCVHQASSENEIVGKYNKLFSEGLVKLQGVKASFSVPAESKPIFCRPRTVPFSLQDLVKRGIQRLHREGIVSRVRSSRRAATVVPVLKEDGTIRIYGDFKMSVNKVVTQRHTRSPGSKKCGKNWRKVQRYRSYTCVTLTRKLSWSLGPKRR